MRKFQKFLTAALCSSFLLPAAAFAQAEDVPKEGDQVDEPIVVTATLRTMDVQDIPLAVTAVSPATLERQGVSDIKSLSSISPSFNIQSSQTETQGTSIKIRGVGTTGNNTGLESSVGVFIDGVYQSRPGVALGDLVDLERLEILRGPQGTLFGRNTSAGALNISTLKPKLSGFSGFANASYGNYNFIGVQAGVNLPIAKDVAALRLSGTYRKRDGFLKSSTGAESNDRDRYMLRGQLYIEPSSDISIRLIGDYSKVNEQCCDAVIVRESETAPAFAFNGLANDGVLEFGQSALNNLASNSQQFTNDSTQWGISGELKWDFGGAKLTYIGSYRDFSSLATSESDFTQLRIFTVGTGGSIQAPGVLPNGDDIKTFTQELRLQGTAFGDKLDWLIGGFYSNEDIAAQQTMSFGPDFQAALTAGNFGTLIGSNGLFNLTALGNLTGLGGSVPGTRVNSNGSFANNLFTQDAKSFSVFTHNVFNITEKLNVTVGARYVDEKKDASFRQLGASNNACQAIVTSALSGTLLPAVGNSAAAFNGAIGLTCFPFAVPVNIAAPAGVGGGLASRFLPLPREWANTFKDNEITYTAQVGYKANDDLLLYGGYSHGFKSGGFNLDPTAANLTNAAAVAGGAAPVFADPRFESEKVDQIELGVKATFGRIKANVALFDMTMSDFQVLEFTGVQFLTFNVAEAKSTGVEVEVFGKLSDHISANFSATYANSRYPSTCAVGVPAAALAAASRLCGQVLTNAPKIAGVFGMTYDGPINDSDWGLIVNGNINYSDRRQTRTINLDTNLLPVPLAFQEASFKMNARIGLTTPDQKMTFELWGTNLNNEITRGITANTPLRGGEGVRSLVGFVEEPRMYGLTVRTKF
jgi:iron complex outermembrane recepter protein